MQAEETYSGYKDVMPKPSSKTEKKQGQERKAPKLKKKKELVPEETV